MPFFYGCIIEGYFSFQISVCTHVPEMSVYTHFWKNYISDFEDGRADLKIYDDGTASIASFMTLAILPCKMSLLGTPKTVEIKKWIFAMKIQKE